jgi:hypothetical protein
MKMKSPLTYFNGLFIDFDPFTGVYAPPGSVNDRPEGTKDFQEVFAVSIFPNPSLGENMSIEL